MKLIRILAPLAFALVAASSGRAQTFTTLNWGVDRGATPSPVCIMTGATCTVQIGTANLGTGVWSIAPSALPPTLPAGLTIPTPTIIGPLTLTPPTGLAKSITSSQTVSGTSALSNTNLNELLVVSDNADVGANNLWGLVVDYTCCGSSAKGQRFVSGANVHVATPSNVADPLPAYVANVGIIAATTNAPNSTAGIWGGNFNSALRGVTGWAQISAAEMDVTVTAGSSVVNKIAIPIVLGPGDAVFGTTNDAAIQVYTVTGITTGFKAILQIDSRDGGKPIATAGTFISTKGAMTFANGIDMSSATLTGNFIAGPGSNFIVTNTGQGISNFGVVAAPAVDAPGYQVVGNTASLVGFQANAFASNSRVSFHRADTSASAPSAVQNGEVLGVLAWKGYGATGYGNDVVQIIGVACGIFTDLSRATCLDLNTTPAGAAAAANAVRINPTGGVTVSSTVAGGDKGAGTLNAGGLYVAGVAVLTANQTITLSGDVSGSGATAITTTIGAGKVTNAMLAGAIDLTTKVAGVLPIANGGTNNSAAYTSGSILYSNGTQITQNNAALFWDAVNLRIGIGSTIPHQKAEIVGGLSITGDWTGSAQLAGLHQFLSVGTTGKIYALSNVAWLRLDIDGAPVVFNSNGGGGAVGIGVAPTAGDLLTVAGRIGTNVTLTTGAKAQARYFPMNINGVVVNVLTD